MAEDARHTSHPIQHPIANESEAMAAFDFRGSGSRSHCAAQA
jgi:hypothetical protein